MHITYHDSSETPSRVKELLASVLVGWIPTKPGMWLRSLLYRTIFQSLGQGVKIDRGCEFFGSPRIQIGNNTFIGHSVYLGSTPTNELVLRSNVCLSDNVRINIDGHQSKIILNDGVFLDRGVDVKGHDRGYIEIGQDAYIGPYGCLAGPGHISIGQNCMIASHTGIYANNHNFDDLTRPINAQGLTSKGIIIEDDCWLGTGVKVLDGVTIGRGSVIGAGSVVTKSIPPFSIAVGVPAKVIKKRGSQHSPLSLVSR